MMAIMRKLINTRAYKIILWLFLFMMAVGSGIMFNLTTEKKWVIKVYEDIMAPVRFDALLRAVKAQKEMYRQKGIILANKNVEKEAIVAALSELLKEHAMSDLHVAVPASRIDAKVKEELAGLPPAFFNQKGELNEEMFLRVIAPQTLDDFLKSVRSNEVGNMLTSLVEVSVYIPHFELDLQNAVEFATKDYSLVKISGQKFLTKVKETAVSAEALEKFYKKSKNNEQFRTAERRSGVLWKFDQNKYGITVTEGDIKKDYEKNKKDYLITPSQMQVRLLTITHEPGAQEVAREKIEGLYKQAEANPESFATLVKEFSDDKTAAKNGGLTKLFSQDDTELDKAIVKTAFESLITDGQISAPVTTDKGYVLIQRVKKNPAQYKDLSLVSDSIRDSLKTSKFRQRFQQDANRVVSQARYNPELVEKFVQKGYKTELPLTSNKGSVENSHLFKTDEGKYTVFFDKNDGMILLCKEIEKSKIPALHEVKDAVLAKYYEEESASLLENALAQALQAVQAGKSMEQVAKEFDAKLETAHFAYKNGSVEQSPILQQSAVQAKIKTLSHEGATTSVISDKDGLVIRLNSIKALDSDSLTKRNELEKTISYAKKYKVKEGFIASLYRRAKLDNKIEMKQEVLHLLKEA